MRFELSNSTPPHLNRGLQLRMLSFVALFAIVLFVLNAVQPRPNKPGQPGRQGRTSASLGNADDSDRQSGSGLGDSAFLAPPEMKDHPPPDRPGDWKEPPPMDPMPADGLDREIARRDARFDKRVLDKIKDNTIGIRLEEADAYYRLLDHARRVPAEELDEAGLTDVQYINLMDQPNRFRGEPIRIHGDLFRLRSFTASENQQHISTVYEGWVFTADSSNHPYRILCTSIPRDFEMGEDIRKPVQVTGYFFKREGYASNGGMHVAPTLLANQIESYRPPGAPPDTDAIVPYMIGFVSAVGLAFLVTLASFVLSDRRAARTALQRKLNSPTPSFAGITGDSTPAVEETLRLFAEQELADAREELTGQNVSELLHARDHLPENSSRPAPISQTEQELVEQRRREAETVQNWTAQQSREVPSSFATEPNGAHRDTSGHIHSDSSRLEAPVVTRPVETDNKASSLHGFPVQQPASVESDRPTDNPIISYSRLAAWEQEIEQLNSQHNGHHATDASSNEQELADDRDADDSAEDVDESDAAESNWSHDRNQKARQRHRR